MKRPARTLSLALVTLATSCLDSQQGRVGDAADASDDTRPSPSDASLETTAGPDTTTTPDTATSPSDSVTPPDACTPTLALGGTSRVTFDRWDDGLHLVLDGGVIYGARLVEGASGGFDVEIVAVDVDTLDERLLTDNTVDDAVVDARGGAVLVWQRDGQTQSLARVGPGAWSYTLPEGFMLVPGFVDDGAPRRMIDGPRAAWAERWVGGGPEDKGRIRTREGGQMRTIADVAGWARPPFLRGRSVVWAEQRPGQLEVVLRRAMGDEVVEVARGEIASYAQIEGAVVWIEPVGVVARRDGERIVLREGACGALAVGEDVVAAVCTDGGEPPSTGGYVARGDVAVARPGEGTWTLPIDDGVVVAGLRVDGARAAWVEYPPDVGCGASPVEDRGALVVADYRSGVRLVVDEVGAGCWCCGAYWPPIGVALAGERVAWSYALPIDENPWEGPGSVGIARVTTAGCRP